MTYMPSPARYDAMSYRRSGRSGMLLPAISLGLWNNFGHDTPPERSRRMLFMAFDLGITHFDLANNYGPPPGAAEEFFGGVLRSDFAAYRDEMIVSTKAGWQMWDGPYGDWGSRKYLIASLDQSLKRLGLDYVDIFYSHRPDPATPIEETMRALDAAVRQGKALYVGISSYRNAETAKAAQALRELGTPAVIHQPSYSMFNRWTEHDRLLDRLEAEGMGCIAFSPLAQGVLTDRYLDGIPADSRAAGGRFLKAHSITPENVARVRALQAIAKRRGQTLAQMALAWVLRDPRMTSALIGASRPEQIRDAVGALSNTSFTAEELAEIEPHAVDGALNVSR
jgi:L-glyceraldehyde 3-phosphate reductase